jgi:hypothetical protein
LSQQIVFLSSSTIFPPPYLVERLTRRKSFTTLIKVRSSKGPDIQILTPCKPCYFILEEHKVLGGRELAVLATAGFVVYEKVGAGISGYEFDVEV